MPIKLFSSPSLCLEFTFYRVSSGSFWLFPWWQEASKLQAKPKEIQQVILHSQPKYLCRPICNFFYLLSDMVREWFIDLKRAICWEWMCVHEQTTENINLWCIHKWFSNEGRRIKAHSDNLTIRLENEATLTAHGEWWQCLNL